MRPRTRLGVLVGAFVLVGALVLGSPAATPESGEVHEPSGAETSRTLVQPGPDSTVELWPYTSRTRTFEPAGLPINVVVGSDAETVRQLLVADGAVHWNATGAGVGPDVRAGVGRDVRPGIEWRPGHGADRYTYVRTADGGRWLAQTHQLRDGSYFGTQYHVRVYAVETDDTPWTVAQAHHEHWDWFRLRHTVDSVAGAQYHLENDLVDKGLEENISRERYGNGGAIDADGWVTVVEPRTNASDRASDGPDRRGPPLPPAGGVLALSIVGAVLAVDARLDRGSAGVPGRLGRHHVALSVSTALLLPVVRVGGVTVEGALPGMSPYLVGAPFYLLLVIGYPALAVHYGRRLPSEDAFAAAVLGMGTGIMVDYAYLGVTALPYDAIVHRFVLLFGLGMIAAGGTRWATDALARHRYRLVGLVVWIGAILHPLVGF